MLFPYICWVRNINLKKSIANRYNEGGTLFEKVNVLLIALFSIFICSVTAANCFAGAWTMPKGELYARFALNYYTADQNYDEDGDRVDFEQNGDFYDVNGSAYVEYGWLNRVTLIVNTSYKYLEYENDDMTSESYGLADIDLAVRYLLYHGSSNAISIQGLLKVPEAYDESDDVPLGNGQYDLELRILYGQSLYPMIPGYCNFEAGYRFRREEPADEFRYLVEMGIDITPKSYARVKLDGIIGMGNEGHDFDMNGNPTTTEDFDLGKLDVCLGYKISRAYGIEVAYTPALYGKNTAAGSTWTIAFVLHR